MKINMKKRNLEYFESHPKPASYIQEINDESQ